MVCGQRQTSAVVSSVRHTFPLRSPCCSLLRSNRLQSPRLRKRRRHRCWIPMLVCATRSYHRRTCGPRVFVNTNVSTQQDCKLDEASTWREEHYSISKPHVLCVLERFISLAFKCCMVCSPMRKRSTVASNKGGFTIILECQRGHGNVHKRVTVCKSSGCSYPLPPSKHDCAQNFSARQ